MLASISLPVSTWKLHLRVEKAITFMKGNVGIKSVASMTSKLSKFPFSHNDAPLQQAIESKG